MINFFAKNITAEARAEFMDAVSHEAAGMNIQLLDDSISKLEKKIANENDNYTKEEVQAFQQSSHGQNLKSRRLRLLMYTIKLCPQWLRRMLTILETLPT